MFLLALSVAHISAAAYAQTTVPITFLPSGHIVVHAMVDGKGPVRLALDTGSPVTFLSRAASARLGILRSGYYSPGLLGPLTTTSTHRFAIGRAVTNDLGIVVLDHPVIQMLSTLHGGVDGIVGFSFLARFRITIDYKARTATFIPVAFVPPDVISSVMNALGKDAGERTVISPAAQWGIRVDAAEGGVAVREVYAGSAAEAAGLLVGDVITSVDGRWTESVQRLFEVAGSVRPGFAASLRVERQKRILDLRILPRPGI